MDSRQKFMLTLIILCCVGSIVTLILGVAGAAEAKRSGMIEGTEEFYVKKFELDELKKILVDAVAANTKVIPPEKTMGDFIETDDYIDYKIQLASNKKSRDATIARSQPHIDRIKLWCAKHYDALERFKKSKNIKITYLDGTERTPLQFYVRYMDNVSNEGKNLLLKVCKK
jgi:hypothetical protein